jgi:uncharacterized protein DUF6328
VPTRVDKAGPAVETESLKEEARNIHEEARMVLPGIQALFGFQLIASFNQRFGELDAVDSTIYFISLLIVALVTGMVMTPAAYHRICERRTVSDYFTLMSSRLLACAMSLLAIAIGADIYIVGQMLFDDVKFSVLAGAGSAAVLLALWLAFPMWRRIRMRR